SYQLDTNVPVVSLVRSDLTLTGGLPLVSRGVDSGPIPTENGVSLIAVGSIDHPSTLNLQGPVLDLGGVRLVDPNPQIQLSFASVSISEVTDPPMITVSGLPVSLAGP